jgi:hypothetical protein
MARKAKIDNAFLKRFERKETKRGKDTKSKRVYFLIVCEGEKAEANKIKCAWTNEAFELWFLFHFQYVNTALNRDSYKSYLEREVRRKGLTNYRYAKNSTLTYSLLKSIGNKNQAIAWAKLLDDVFKDKSYSTHNPCTKVHLLVEELNNPEDIINAINNADE